VKVFAAAIGLLLFCGVFLGVDTAFRWHRLREMGGWCMGPVHSVGTSEHATHRDTPAAGNAVYNSRMTVVCMPAPMRGGTAATKVAPDVPTSVEPKGN
jgi:hypothetical protein